MARGGSEKFSREMDVMKNVMVWRGEGTRGGKMFMQHMSIIGT